MSYQCTCLKMCLLLAFGMHCKQHSWIFGSNCTASTGNSIQVVYNASRQYPHSFNTVHAFSASYHDQVSHCRNVFLSFLGVHPVLWLVQYANVSLITTSGQAFACTAVEPPALPMSGVSPCSGLEDCKGVGAHHMLLCWDRCRVLRLPCRSEGQMCYALPHPMQSPMPCLSCP